MQEKMSPNTFKWFFTLGAKILMFEIFVTKVQIVNMNKLDLQYTIGRGFEMWISKLCSHYPFGVVS
jgi:hypothetical protein